MKKILSNLFFVVILLPTLCFASGNLECSRKGEGKFIIYPNTQELKRSSGRFYSKEKSMFIYSFNQGNCEDCYKIQASIFAEAYEITFDIETTVVDGQVIAKVTSFDPTGDGGSGAQQIPCSYKDN